MVDNAPRSACSGKWCWQHGERMSYSPVSPCRLVDQRVTGEIPDAGCRPCVAGIDPVEDTQADPGTIGDGPRLFPCGRLSPIAVLRGAPRGTGWGGDALAL